MRKLWVLRVVNSLKEDSRSWERQHLKNEL